MFLCFKVFSFLYYHIQQIKRGTTQKIGGKVPASTSEVTTVTFVNLIKSAGRKHRQKVSKTKQKNQVTKGYHGNPESSSSLESGNGLHMR